MTRFVVDILGLASLLATLTSCEAPTKPPKAANAPVKITTPTLDAAAPHSEDADAGAAAPPPLLQLDAGAPDAPSSCVGVAIDLAKALSDEACYVPPPASPRFPGAVKVTLTTTPTELRDHQLALATLTLRNTSASVESVYFTPSSRDHIRFELDLLDPRTLERHDPNPILFPALAAAPVRWARIELGAFGEATFQACWQAKRTTGRALRLSPPDAVSLDTGEYLLIFGTAIAGFATTKTEQGMLPSVKVRVVAGKRCSLIEDPPCACPMTTPQRPVTDQVP